MRTEDFAFLVFGKGQHLGECFLAGVAVELVVGHRPPPNGIVLR
jgi:hypothetical protein